MGECLSGCQNGRNGFLGGCGNNSCIWILLILLCCGGNGFGCGDDCCSIIWILLILCFCGNGCGNQGCGCGC
ncbi:MAG: chorion class high-cysteine HCB protein 13 [Clostridiales bacterium]|nr:chorion class high-cysteine HCB protein 13 [Clostridiales bacterium]